MGSRNKNRKIIMIKFKEIKSVKEPAGAQVMREINKMVVFIFTRLGYDVNS